MKYRPGPRAFGGTMALIRKTVGPSSLAVAIPVPPSYPIHPIFLARITGTSSQPTGRGYADALHNVWDGPVWENYKLMYVSRPVVGVQKLITMVSPPYAMTLGSHWVAQYRHGFPFTTGTVLARETGTIAGKATILTFTAMGKDVVTAMGARNISLVAGGGAAIRFTGDVADFDVSREPIIAQMMLPEPGAMAQWLAGVIGLLATATWRARNR